MARKAAPTSGGSAEAGHGQAAEPDLISTSEDEHDLEEDTAPQRDVLAGTQTASVLQALSDAVAEPSAFLQPSSQIADIARQATKVTSYSVIGALGSIAISVQLQCPTKASWLIHTVGVTPSLSAETHLISIFGRRCTTTRWQQAVQRRQKRQPALAPQHRSCMWQTSMPSRFGGSWTCTPGRC